MAIVELKKPAFRVCPNQCPAGCAVYGSHPKECKTFQCIWLSDDQERLTRAEERPDRVGIVVTLVGFEIDLEDFRERYGYLPLQAFESWPGSSKTWAAQKLLKRLSRRFIVVVSIYDSVERAMYGPENLRSGVLDKLQRIAERNAKRERDDPKGWWNDYEKNARTIIEVIP